MCETENNKKIKCNMTDCKHNVDGVCDESEDFSEYMNPPEE